MLEPVAGTAADEQDVLHTRVEVDQEIAVRAVLVLANARFGERSAFEQRETAVAVGDYLRERRLGRAAVLRVGIDRHPVRVVRELDAPALEIGKAVENVTPVEVGPAGHCAGEEAAIAGGRSE